MKKQHFITKTFIFSIFFSLSLVLQYEPLKVIAENRGAVSQKEERAPSKFSGSLDIRIHPQEGKLEPSVEPLISDPYQKRSGWDSNTKKVVLEIPGSSFEKVGIDDDINGGRGPRTLILYLSNPGSGEYTLQVIGRESDRYSLEIHALDCEMTSSSVIFTQVMITQGAVHQYRIKYSNMAGSRVDVQVQTEISLLKHPE